MTGTWNFERPRFVLIAVVSADGFVARASGHTPADWASAEDQDWFRRDMAQMSWSFMGRVTHEAAPRPDRRRVVFTRAAATPRWATPTQLMVDPARTPLPEIVAMIRPAGPCGILGATEVYDHFLDRGLVDEMRLTVEPVTFGSGRPLFTALDAPTIDWLTARGFVPAEPPQRLNEIGSTRWIFVPNRARLAGVDISVPPA
jgi:dihydrofolate reductase